LEIVAGNLLDQNVDVIVNAWNRNMIPWWLLLPQGVSGAIRKHAGVAPFKELSTKGHIPLGGAVLTSAGNLSFKGIIHVAGINIFWRATETSIRRSVDNAMRIVEAHGFGSVAFPIIGAGTGSFNKDKALSIMLDQFRQQIFTARVLIVEFDRNSLKKR